MQRLTVTALMITALSAFAAEQSATLADLTAEADQIVIGRLGMMRRAMESQPVATLDGQQLEGKFVFTYVEVALQEQLLGAQAEELTVRVLGGIHPSARSFTTYVDAPGLATDERALLFLKKVPGRGPNGEDLHQIVRHRAGKFHVTDTELGPVVSRDIPNSGLAIDPAEGVSEAPISLAQIKRLIGTELSKRSPRSD